MREHEDPEKRLSALAEWLEQDVTPFLKRWDPDRSATLKYSLDELRHRWLPSHKELPICFLGKAGVGKSTLINALVDPVEAVVPQGGVGPLTAQATVVRWSERPYLQAKYHGITRVNQLIFALDSYIKGRTRRSGASQQIYLNELEAAEVALALPPTEYGTEEDRVAIEERLRSYISQARQLVTGKQFREENVDDLDEVVYLSDALRFALGRPPVWGFDPRSEHIEFLRELGYAAAAGEAGLRIEEDSDHPRHELLREVARHATGSVAPLIKHLEVGWDSRTLPRGVTLVDLPGVGVANDEYRNVTSAWIRRASAVVLVVDRSGLTEPEAHLLHTSGYLNALLHRAPGARSVSPLLWVITVKLDDVAKDDRNAHRQQNPGKPVPATISFFNSACQSSERVRREQLTQLLESITINPTDEERESHKAVLEQLQLFGVSAAQYRKLNSGDEDDPPWIKSADDSRIPSLLGELRTLAERHDEEVTREIDRRLAEIWGSLRRGVTSVLNDLQRSTRDQDRIAKLESAFDDFVQPLALELENRRGALREKLRSTIPKVIETEVAKATRNASDPVDSYLQSLRGRHWATLRATVRRGGAFVKDASGTRRNIDVPNELALRFEAALAVVWNRAVVTQVTRAFADYGKDVSRTLERILVWAAGPDIKLDQARVKEYRDDVQEGMKSLGKTVELMAERLREEAKARLHETIQASVRARCQQFVAERRDVGAGVSVRVADLLRELGKLAGDTARTTAADFLRQTYETAAQEIASQFQMQGDPVGRVRTLLFALHSPTDATTARENEQQAGAANKLLAQADQYFLPPS